MASTVKSRKAKARRLQNLLARELLNIAIDLTYDDVKPAVMGDHGSDIKLSRAAKVMFPYSFECKNREQLNIWDAIKQAQENAQIEGLKPVLVFHRNRLKEPWVAIQLELFLDLMEAVLNAGAHDIRRSSRQLGSSPLAHVCGSDLE